MEKKLRGGFFITFEGPEGSGKSVHSRNILEELVSKGLEAVHTAEPGDTALGKMIREILLEKENIRMDRFAELFLFAADRAQHIEEVICPALEAKKIIICDRFSLATFAYQGYGLGMDMDHIEKVNTLATGGIEPDLTILLDVDVEIGLERAGSRGAADRMENRGREFHEKVRQGYLDMAGKCPDKIKVIKVRDNIDETYALIKKEVYEVIESRKGY